MPQILYKYRCWDDEKHRRMLQEREIFFTSPANFNDPFDCKIPINFYDMDVDVAKQHIKKHFEGRGEQLSNMEKRFAIDDALHEFKREGESEKAREKNRVDVLKSIEERFGIFSTSEICNDILMWSHYSDMHKGFCVGFDWQGLFKAVENECSNRIGCVLLPVIYQKDFPKLIFEGGPQLEKLEKAIATKALQWKYEREYRFILNGRTNVPMVLPKGVVREVAIGAEATKETAKEITEVVRSSDSGIKLYQARLAKDKFALEFDEVE